MNPPWMPFYVADYLRDTRRLTAAEHGAYLLLIMEYWISGALPNDDRQLARIACMSLAEWKKAKPNVQPFFGPDWIHKRIDIEIEKAQAKYRLRSEAGKRGGIASANAKQKPSNAASNAQASSSQPQPLDRMVDERARGKSSFTDGSNALASAFWKAIGLEDPIDIPPEFAGVQWRAVEWETAGWTVDLIDAEARKVARDKPLKPLSYFEKVFATSFAKRQTPLPIVEVREAEKLTVTSHGKTQAAGDIRKVGFAGLAARLQHGYSEQEADRPAPEDLKPVNGHRDPA